MRSMRSKLAALALILAGLAAVDTADGFFSRGVIDATLGYSDLQIYKDQEEYFGGNVLVPPYGAGSRHGRRWSPYGVLLRDEYYLNGVLENLSSRTRYGLRVVFYASDCVRERIHWTVTVAVDSLGPHRSLPFREFISYVEPTFPCRFRFHVSEEGAPGAAVQPPPPSTASASKPLAEEWSTPAAPDGEAAADDSPIYKWLDERGVWHYTNRSSRSDERQWEPAWEEGAPDRGD